MERITETMVRREVENLTVLTFEVTERCNLRCRYCAFGDLYYGYDERKGENLDFPKAKQILDFLFGIGRKYLTYQLLALLLLVFMVVNHL